MVCKPIQNLRAGALIVVVCAPVGGRVALALGHGYGVLGAASAAQAVAAGVMLWASWPLARWAGPVLSLALLASLAAGSAWSVRMGVLAMSGVAHMLLYGALLALFGRSLRRGQESLVTGVARRVNPAFHSGMVPYTRGVTMAWCLLFAGELAGSAALLASAPGWWAWFVGGLHLAPAAALMVSEVLLRRRVWRHDHATGLIESVRGLRKIGRRA